MNIAPCFDCEAKGLIVAAALVHQADPRPQGDEVISFDLVVTVPKLRENWPR